MNFPMKKNALLLFAIASLAVLRAEEQTANVGSIPDIPISYRVAVERAKDRSTHLKIVLKNEGDSPYYMFEADAPWTPRWLAISIFSDRVSGDQQAQLRSENLHGIALLDGAGVSGKYITLPAKGEVSGFYPLGEQFGKVAELNARRDLYIGWSFALQLNTTEPYRAPNKGALETSRVGGLLLMPKNN